MKRRADASENEECRVAGCGGKYMEILIRLIPIIIIVILAAVIMLTGYVKASPDVAVIISGLKKTPRVLIGRAGLKVPYLEKDAVL